MTQPTIASILAAKAKLTEELRLLEQQEAQLLQEQTAGAFAQVIDTLERFANRFSSEQKADIAARVGSGAASLPKAAAKSKPRADLPPKYWLPHNGETWSGRGRMPKLFAIWEGSASYKAWKAKHPDEKFPRFPG